MAEPRPPDAGRRDGFALWIYGVMDGAVTDPLRCAGVDERHRAVLLRHVGLAAIVSAVARADYDQRALEQSLEDLERLEALARGHERVLDEALTGGPVVPFRMCTIYDSEDHVRRMLEAEHGALAEILERLSGMVEWGVKAYVTAGGAPARTPATENPASGTDYLARKHHERNAADRARRATDATAEVIHGRLREQAVDAVLSRPQDPSLSGRREEMVLNAAYLVPDARVAGFRTLFGELARRHEADGLVLQLTGPWPAYHFAGSRGSA
jgi:hypothetical protein